MLRPALHIVAALILIASWIAVGAAIWSYERFDWIDRTYLTLLIFFGACGMLADVLDEYVRETKPR